MSYIITERHQSFRERGSVYWATPLFSPKAQIALFLRIEMTWNECKQTGVKESSRTSWVCLEEHLDFHLCWTLFEFALKFSYCREVSHKSWRCHYFPSLTFLSYFQMKLYLSAGTFFSSWFLVDVCSWLEMKEMCLFKSSKKIYPAASGDWDGKSGTCHLHLSLSCLIRCTRSFSLLLCYTRS